MKLACGANGGHYSSLISVVKYITRYYLAFLASNCSHCYNYKSYKSHNGLLGYKIENPNARSVLIKCGIYY